MPAKNAYGEGRQLTAAVIQDAEVGIAPAMWRGCVVLLALPFAVTSLYLAAQPARGIFRRCRSGVSRVFALSGSML